MKSKRSSLFRADVSRSLEHQARDVQTAQHRLRLAAGVYNVQPWGYLLGVVGALLAVLFAAYAATTHGQRALTPATLEAPQQTPAPDSTNLVPMEELVPIELE